MAKPRLPDQLISHLNAALPAPLPLLLRSRPDPIEFMYVACGFLKISPLRVFQTKKTCRKQSNTYKIMYLLYYYKMKDRI